jgi:hypothetical protein
MRNKVSPFLALITIKTYICMNSEMKALLTGYYLELGLTPSKTRMKEQVQARAAIMVALREYTTTTAIGKLFGMDHSSIVHHCRKHDANIMYWDGYAKMFDIAKKHCRMLRYKSRQAKLKTVRLEINRLKRIEQKLIENSNPLLQ